MIRKKYTTRLMLTGGWILSLLCALPSVSIIIV